MNAVSVPGMRCVGGRRLPNPLGAGLWGPGLFLFVCVAVLMADPRESYTHDTVREPVADTFALTVPAQLGNRVLAEQGYVDVTAAPFEADPTGIKDSTSALQRAIDCARDNQMVCCLPVGTYLVSDTLNCVQGFYRRQNGKISGGRMYPCVLEGIVSSTGERPVIRLKTKSAGFGDPAQPKYVIHFWARGMQDPAEPQPNICFNQVFRRINITIDPGNPGAVGIRMRGAQGSGIQDTTITAKGALKGLEGGCGSGGSHALVKIIGGTIGADLTETQPAATITGFVFEGQEGPALVYGGRQALCAVGLQIDAHRTPAIEVKPAWDQHYQGPLCLIDASIRFAEGNAGTAVFTSRSVYLQNVLVRNAEHVVRGPGDVLLPGRSGGGMYVREFAATFPARPYKGLQYRMPLYVNGTLQAQPLIDTGLPSDRPAAWNAQHMQSLYFGTGVSVRQAPYCAAGDGLTDDTDALQQAINANRAVFLPKGLYVITRPLELKPDTRLVGAAKHLAFIVVRRPGEAFSDPSTPRPAILTADTAEASTVISSLGILVPEEVPGAYALAWRSGWDSVVHDVMFWLRPLVGYGVGIPKHPPRTSALVRISGHGGGRWYNFFAENMTEHPDYRHLLIEDTQGPLVMYQCNVEHAHSDANMELRRAAGIFIYGLKGEFNAPIFKAVNSSRFAVFGYGGNASAYPGASLFLVENCQDFTFANLVDSPRLPGEGTVGKGPFGGGTDPHTWYMLIEKLPDGTILRTTPLDRPTLYKRAAPGAPETPAGQ